MADVRVRDADNYVLEVGLAGTLVAGAGETVFPGETVPVAPSFDDVTYERTGANTYVIADDTQGPENDSGSAVNAGTAVIVRDGEDTGPSDLESALVSTDSSITYTVVGAAGTDQTLSIEVNEANVDHDSLSGFVANEHVDHSSVSVVAGGDDGLLAANNDLTTNIGLAVDIAGTTALGVAPDAGDEILINDVSGPALRKITVTQLLSTVAANDTLGFNGGIPDVDASEAANAAWGPNRSRAGITMRVAGNLIGFTFTSDRVITAGQIQVAVSINGVIQNGVGQVLTHTAGQNGSLTFPAPIAVAVDDIVDMHARANAGMTPNNQDLTVMFEVEK